MTNEPGPVPAPHCVLMDIDNTIYDYDICHRTALAVVGREATKELNLGQTDFVRVYDQARVQIKEKLGTTASSHNRLLYFQRVLELVGLGSQPLRAMSLEQIYWRSFLEQAELFDEVEEFLDDLRIAGVPVIFVTDLTASIQMRKFIYWRLDRFTNWLVTSEESGADKPDPAMFELALAKIGGVEGTVWMVGDNPEKDMAGAKEAVGAMTFLRHSSETPQADKESADFTFRSFGEMRAFLRRAK